MKQQPSTGGKVRADRAKRLLHRLVDDRGYVNHHMEARAETGTLTEWDISFIELLARDYGITDTQPNTHNKKKG